MLEATCGGSCAGAVGQASLPASSGGIPAARCHGRAPPRNREHGAGMPRQLADEDACPSRLTRTPSRVQETAMRPVHPVCRFRPKGQPRFAHRHTEFRQRLPGLGFRPAQDHESPAERTIAHPAAPVAVDTLRPAVVRATGEAWLPLTAGSAPQFAHPHPRSQPSSRACKRHWPDCPAPRTGPAVGTRPDRLTSERGAWVAAR